MMESFITKDGKKLRRGYTTGSCAAAAAKAAAIMLLEDRILPSVFLITPYGIGLELEVFDIQRGENRVSCSIVKDSGDDPDITNGMKVFARVEKTDSQYEITVDGGEGIGRVTKPGLDQPIGSAAINSIPRKMIAEELRYVCEDNGYTGGLNVVIFAPQGEELAKKTFNPKLGIVGGISILGTTGIVEPMSDEAVIQTIRTELSVRAAEGKRAVLFTPGNYGMDFIKKELRFCSSSTVMTSNFIGDAFLSAKELGFTSAVIVGHIGKLIKVSDGVFNTHSRYGDRRAEIFASHARKCSADENTVKQILQSTMTDDMISIIETAGLREKVMKSITDEIDFHLRSRVDNALQVGAVVFSNVYGILGKTEQADIILEKIKKDG